MAYGIFQTRHEPKPVRIKNISFLYVVHGSSHQRVEMRYKCEFIIDKPNTGAIYDKHIAMCLIVFSAYE